jgi:RimJ/RimL family protein N-acetyltransferase
MARQHPALIRLEPWSDADFPLLVRLNAPEMTEHLGGPETDEQLRRRHERYVAAGRTSQVHDSGRTFAAYVYKVIFEADGHAVGGVNFWEREWRGEDVYEMGWGVVPEYQGRGIASAAVSQAIELARGLRRRRAVHAFPSTENGPSNAICRKAGFELLGEAPFEYPKGHWMRCNDWRITLGQ